MKVQENFLIRLATNKKEREALKQDPRGFLKKNHLDYSDKREIKVLENTETKKYFVIRMPKEIESTLSDDSEMPKNQRDFFQQLAQSNEFKEKFKKDPLAIFKSCQIDIPYTKCVVVEDSDRVTHWILPEFNEITQDEQLQEIAGGKDYLGEAVQAFAPDPGRAFATGFFFPVTFPAIGMAAASKWIVDKISGT